MKLPRRLVNSSKCANKANKDLRVGEEKIEFIMTLKLYKKNQYILYVVYMLFP